MTHVETATVLKQTTVQPAKRRQRNRLRTPPFDQRTRYGRRYRHYIKLFRERVGAGVSDALVVAKIEHAARLMALAEQASAKALRNDPSVTLDEVIRLQRSADLAVRKLDLDGKPPAGTAVKPTSQPPLASYLAGKGDSA
jgi:hypothetical protein